MKSKTILAVILPLALMAGCAQMGGGMGGSSTAASAQMSDSAITDRIKSNLAADPELKEVAPKLGVSTEKGVVTLKGEIKSMALRRKVESIVRDVPGVKSMDNRLIITG